MFKKIDGYYWVKKSNTSKVGYSTLHSLFVDEFYYGYIALGLFALSALLQIVVLILRVANA